VERDSDNDPLSFSLEDWQREIAPFGKESYRVQQLYSWLHSQRVLDYERMTNLPGPLRQILERQFPLKLADSTHRAKSSDGAVKYLFRATDGARYEAVFLPSRSGASLCISTQVGCSFHCSFCATGTLGLTRNLTASEILHQVYYLANDHKLSSYRVLLMGMGESLANIQHVLKALKHLVHPAGQACSPRRITISTVGIRGRVSQLARETPGVELALSLHFTEDDQRQHHMPAAKRFPLGDLFDELITSDGLGKVTLEYLLLEGVNDTQEDATALATLAYGVVPRQRKVVPPSRLRSRFRGFNAYHVNLIEYNPSPGLEFLPTPYTKAESFQNCLKASGVNATYRRSRGRDVAAACGMLTATEFRSKK
jgi:23S rRNA (adenine2503-C2)-methyltransferase